MREIILNEDVGIKNIKEFYIFFSEILKDESELILDFSRLKRVDLSFAQVLMAAKRLARKDNKTIRLRNVSEDVKRQLQITGLVKQ